MIDKKTQWYEKLQSAILEVDIESLFKLLLTIGVEE